MIAQFILITCLLIIFLYALSQRRRSTAVAIAMMILSLVGCWFVIFPEMANKLANAVGIGRGADAILYCFSILALVAILNIHLRLRAQTETTTDLARAIALMSAARPHAAERRAAND